MKTLLYDGSPKDHAQVGRTLQELPKRASGYCIIIKENRPIRSLKANAFYWLVINIYAIHTGHTAKEIDNLFRMDRHFKVIINSKGQEKRIPLETKVLDTKEYSSHFLKLSVICIYFLKD